MRQAIPADLLEPNILAKPSPGSPTFSQDEPKVLSYPLAPKASSTFSAAPQQRTAAPVPRTVGRLFFTNSDGVDRSCSGSTINNKNGNLVMTAGHCVHGGKGKGWSRNIVFVPAYYNGSRPLGTWYYQDVVTFSAWINDSDFYYDQAMVKMAPNAQGRNIISVAGGNGLVSGNSTVQPNTRIWGYPADQPYNGQRPYYCDGDTNTYAFNANDSAMNCDMTGGASGGPWLKDRVNDNLGYVYAVTSRRTYYGRPLLLAAPNSSAVWNLYNFWP